ncbi:MULTISPECIES: hypothetical protein [unclassified Bradyrhizobium]|uniref:hypothetical protein n=1 Tax=unclassified Bradyrhizobium TaxID=2631580 RepID=UPI002FEE9B5C
MTADFCQFEMKFLGKTATRIISEVKGVSGRSPWIARPAAVRAGRERRHLQADRDQRHRSRRHRAARPDLFRRPDLFHSFCFFM